ncbi:MAG TPA: hypothetical protein VHO90_01315, partial [Bacteroidales bacterium]|nr:hypothetical protein [Bacteroidales bacterium]
MRLLTKTFTYYIFLAAAIFAIGGVISYFPISHVFYEQVDEGITTEKEIIAEEIENNENIPDYSLRFGHQIEVILLNRPGVPHHFIKDTTYTAGDSPEKFRYLYYSNNRKGNRAYIIKIFHPLAETNDLIEGILLVTFVMFSCLFLLLIVVNYYTSKKVWIPFYHTIHQLSHYNINEKKGLAL